MIYEMKEIVIVIITTQINNLPLIKRKVSFWNNDHNKNRNKTKMKKKNRTKYVKLYKEIMTIKVI